MDRLTRDTLHLSGPTVSPQERGHGEQSAINCTTAKPPLPAPVAELVQDSLAGNTRRAYASDLERFLDWGGAIPATDEMVATYLAQHARSHAASTLARWLTSLAKAHRAAGLADPTESELVAATLRGIRRRHGRIPRQAKPLLRDDLLALLDSMGNGVKDARDRALLLIGFAGGFRRAELVALDIADIEPVRQGIILTIRRSKTDQYGEGRRIGIPHGRTRHCPVRALENWQTVSGIVHGAVFRRVNRHGHVLGQRLSGEAVSIILQQRLRDAGFDPAGYSGHSLRAGFATSAAQAGATSWKIRQQTGHASDAMLGRYIREGEMFSDNAAGMVL